MGEFELWARLRTISRGQSHQRDSGYSTLTNANLSGASLTNAHLSSSTLTNANLSGAVVTGASFVTPRRIGFTKEQLYSTASYQGENLQDMDLADNDLTGWDFGGQDLTGADFSGLRG